MKKRITMGWSMYCLAALAGAAPFGSSQALEALFTHFSFSIEGHCVAPHQGEARREDDYNITEIVIDEANGQWLERVVSECFALEEKTPTTPRSVYEAYQTSEEARCPKQSRWSVVLEEPHRLLFEQHRGACGSEPGRMLLGLAIHGKEDRWLVAYSAREPVQDPSDRQAFLDSLEEIEVLTMSSPTLGFPVWGPANGPAWVGRLVRDHEWSDRRDVVSQLPIPSDWRLTQRANDRSMPLWAIAITPPGRALDTASEALMLVSVPRSNWNAQQHLDAARIGLRKQCGAKAALNVLLQEQGRLVTETVASGCGKVDYEYRLAAFLQGSETLFQAEYLARKAAHPDALRDTWAPRMLAIGIRPVAGPPAQ